MSMATTTRLQSPSTFTALGKDLEHAQNVNWYAMRCWCTYRQNANYERPISAFLSDFTCTFMCRFLCEVDRIKVFTCVKSCWGLIPLFTQLWLSMYTCLLMFSTVTSKSMSFPGIRRSSVLLRLSLRWWADDVLTSARHSDMRVAIRVAWLIYVYLWVWVCMCVSGYRYVSVWSHCVSISISMSISMLQYAVVGPMAITLCQTLGQNIGMMWNKQRPTAGDLSPPSPLCNAPLDMLLE